MITYRLPADSSRARVAIWRLTRRSGALHLQAGVVAFPADPAFAAAVSAFRTEVERVGGQTLALSAAPLDAVDDGRLTRAWNDARDAEYAELEGKCRTFVEEIAREFAILKFTLAELEEEEAEVEKLERWHQRIAARDLHDAPRALSATSALAEAARALERYSDAVYERTKPQ